MMSVSGTKVHPWLRLEGECVTNVHHVCMGHSVNMWHLYVGLNSYRHFPELAVIPCRHAGRSRVRFSNQETLLFHQWTKGEVLSSLPPLP